MPMFECTTCGAVESCSEADHNRQVREKRQPECSLCLSGVWHGRFQRLSVEEAGMVRGSDGLLYQPNGLPNGVREIKKGASR